MITLQILTSSLPRAFVGASYATRLQARGGTGPYVWTVTGLPPGFSSSGTTGDITAPEGGIPDTSAGVVTVSVSVRDALNTVATATLSLEVSPASQLQSTPLILDPRLETLVALFDQGVLTRTGLTSHFSNVPTEEVLGASGLYLGDQFAHTAAQIQFTDATSPLTSPSPSPSSVFDKLVALSNSSQYLAEPVILTVNSFTSTEVTGETEDVVGFLADSGYLGDNEHVVITEHTDGPAYTASPDGDTGYFAVAQKFQIPATARITQLSLYASRSTNDHTGNLIVGISNGGSPNNIHIPAGDSALAFGDGGNLIARATIPVSSIDVDAARSAWDSPQLLQVTLSPTSPGVSPVSLSGDTDYYLTISSDYVLDSPSAGYIQLAASIDTTVSNEVPGSGGALTGHSIALGVTSPGSPYHSPAQSKGDLNSRYETYNSPSPTEVESIAFQMDAVWTGATRGVAQIEIADAFNAGQNDRYWVGTVSAQAAREQAFRIIDGHRNRSTTAIEDLTNFDELVDTEGNPVIVEQLTTIAGNEISPAGGSQTDSRGFLVSEGVVIKLKMSPNPLGELPPTPFKILGGARRLVTDLASDSLIRTANKTGSTDSDVLASILSTLPTNPVLTLSQLPPDASGNVNLLAADSTISLVKNFGSSSITFGLGASVNVQQLGGSPTNVTWSSGGLLTLIGGSNVTLTPGSNQITVNAEPGVTTIASVDPDGSGNVVIQTAEDTNHAGQTFVAITTGTNTVNIGTSIPDSTTSLAGLMAAADKQRLDALFSGTATVTTTGTGSVSGGHAHQGTALQVGRSLAGYSTIGSTTTVADAIEIINQVLSSQFSSVSESANLATMTTSFSPFYTGYIANASPSPGTFSYGSSPYLPGLQNTRLTQVADSSVFTVTTTAFGNPGQADTVSLKVGNASGLVSPALEILDLAGSYSNAITLFGGSPSSSGDYTSVAALMEANPLKTSGSPATKLDFDSVDFLGFKSPSATPVFELIVSADPTIADWPSPRLGYIQIQLSHDTGATTRTTNTIEFFHDTPISGASPELTSSPQLRVSSSATIRRVSGIPHYAANSSVALSVAARDLFNSTYVQQPILFRDADTSDDVAIQYYLADESSPASTAWIPNILDTFTLGSPSSPYALAQQVSYLVNSTNNRESRNFEIVVVDPYGEYSPATALFYADANVSPYGRILHLGRAGLVDSDLQTERFFSEKYRLDPADWGGVDFDSPAGGQFTQFAVQPAGSGTTDADTYGWPNETPLTDFTIETTWNVTSSPDDAEGRSGKNFAVKPGILQSMPAQVSDLGLVNPAYNEFSDYADKRYAPSNGDSPVSDFGSMGSPDKYNYFTDYSAVDSVVYYRLFESTTSTNQGRLRIHGYRRGLSADSLASYEGQSSPLASPHLEVAYYNYGPAQVSPSVPMNGVTAEIKLVGDESATQYQTPRGNPGLTGWLDLLSTPGTSLYEAGEDGYGALDTATIPSGLVQGSGYMDIYWRTGSFSTGLTNNQAVVRIGIHEPEFVVTKVEMLNQSTDTPWSNGV